MTLSTGGNTERPCQGRYALTDFYELTTGPVCPLDSSVLTTGPVCPLGSSELPSVR